MVAVLSGDWELSRASTVKTYRMFGDRELIEPITVFGPNVAKAMGLLGEFWGATLILYELAPETLVHLRIAVLDVAENMDASKADEKRKWRSLKHLFFTLHKDSHTHTCTHICTSVVKREHTVPAWTKPCK